MPYCFSVHQRSLFGVSVINAEYEHIALHRDVSETELKQGREIRGARNLVYVDSAAVRAVKNGRILILEGVEKAERGIMPVILNSSPIVKILMKATL